MGALLVVGCSGRGDSASSGGTQRPAGSPAPADPFESVGRVGNQVLGIDAIPDYDDEARRLRARVEPELPQPLPAAPAACASMLDAARRFYVDTEGEGSAAVSTLASTAAADLRACTADTSPAAASCVSTLMSQSEGEFPRMLDLCSRAFPLEAGR